MSDSLIYKAGMAGHYHVKSHGGIASSEQLTFEIYRLTASLAEALEQRNKLIEENRYVNDMLGNAHNRSRLLEEQLKKYEGASEVNIEVDKFHNIAFCMGTPKDAYVGQPVTVWVKR